VPLNGLPELSPPPHLALANTFVVPPDIVPTALLVGDVPPAVAIVAIHVVAGLLAVAFPALLCHAENAGPPVVLATPVVVTTADPSFVDALQAEIAT
jgi:hypothetical protein